MRCAMRLSSRLAKPTYLATLGRYIVPIGLIKDVMVFPRSILTDHGETAHRTEANVNDIEADGRFATQSSLIFGYLASFPAKTHAIETYDHFCRYVESLPPYMRSKPRIVAFLEKFVLWTICIARKPLVEFTAENLRAFSAFCARPPETWIGIRSARFDINEGTERLSEDWKPFVQPITDPQSGYVLNRVSCLIEPWVFASFSSISQHQFARHAAKRRASTDWVGRVSSYRKHAEPFISKRLRIWTLITTNRIARLHYLAFLPFAMR